MKGLKVAVIGAGSSYTPELIEGFIERRESLNVKNIFLMDIDRTKLDIVGGLAGRMLQGAGINVECTTSLESALDGADYVLAQIRVGGMQARVRDEKIPLKHGLLGQETTGAGGFMNALRTVPVMLNIARKMETLSPNAWLINFSNPSGIITQALNDHTRVKTIGLCNNAINMLADIAKTLDRTDFEYDYVGINHLSFITSVELDGKELIHELFRSGVKAMKNIPELQFEKGIFEAIPAIPCAYLSYYYLRDEQLKKCLEAEKTRGEICMELEAGLMKQYSDPVLNKKPEELASRGGALYSTAAVSVIDAIQNNKDEYHVVNVRNKGALAFLEDGEVVEVKCRVNSRGATPIKVEAPQSDYIVGLVRSVKAYERLTIKAAVDKSYSDAIAALMVHPLIGDYHKAKAVLDDMLEQNSAFVKLNRGDSCE